MTTLHDPDESHQNLNILVAEDNPVNRLLALKLLQKQGHVVTSVNNGREALALWKKNQSRQFDISLLDVQMPEMDGLQATSGIREKEVAAGTHIPIIAVPAHAIKGDRERCLAAGMDGYITKPIIPVELAEKKPGGLSRCRENSWRFDGSGPAGLSRCRENSCRFRGPDPGRPQRCRTARALRR